MTSSLTHFCKSWFVALKRAFGRWPQLPLKPWVPCVYILEKRGHLGGWMPKGGEMGESIACPHQRKTDEHLRLSWEKCRSKRRWRSGGAFVPGAGQRKGCGERRWVLLDWNDSIMMNTNRNCLPCCSSWAGPQDLVYNPKPSLLELWVPGDMQKKTNWMCVLEWVMGLSGGKMASRKEEEVAHLEKRYKYEPFWCHWKFSFSCKLKQHFGIWIGGI